MVDKSAVIQSVCAALANGDQVGAAGLLQRDYPFVSQQATLRRYGAEVLTRVFVRDGFIDQYTGTRLIFSPVLRLLSSVLPVEFPYHPSWKTAATHPAFWELGATIDHVIPVTRGGDDDESNLVTTSMPRNSAKMNYTPQELGWTLQKRGNFDEWDGLLRWFLQFTATNPGLRRDDLRRWRRAATHALAAAKQLNVARVKLEEVPEDADA
jgi:hypothetical protein